MNDNLKRVRTICGGDICPGAPSTGGGGAPGAVGVSGTVKEMSGRAPALFAMATERNSEGRERKRATVFFKARCNERCGNGK